MTEVKVGMMFRNVSCGSLFIFGVITQVDGDFCRATAWRCSRGERVESIPSPDHNYCFFASSSGHEVWSKPELEVA